MAIRPSEDTHNRLVESIGAIVWIKGIVDTTLLITLYITILLADVTTTMKEPSSENAVLRLD